eukprot:gene10866-7532_t
MSIKVLLAEGLDFTRQAEAQEYELDKRWNMVKDNAKKMKRDLAKLVHDYETVYRTYIKGLEVLNHVRHKVADHPNPQSATQDRQIGELCGAKMVTYMDRCAGITKKLSKIFIPVDQISVPMEGFSAGEELIAAHDIVLNSKCETFEQTVSLTRGTYVLTVSFNDDYTFAAPDVEVQLRISPRNSAGARFESETVKVEIPCLMGWRRIVGTTGASLEVKVKASGKRDAHISVHLNEWLKNSSEVFASDGAAANPRRFSPLSAAAQRSLQPVAVRPAGATCQERLDLLTLATASWPTDGVVAVKLGKEEERFVQSIFALPMPSDLN